MALKIVSFKAQFSITNCILACSKCSKWFCLVASFEVNWLLEIDEIFSRLRVELLRQLVAVGQRPSAHRDYASILVDAKASAFVVFRHLFTCRHKLLVVMLLPIPRIPFLEYKYLNFCDKIEVSFFILRNHEMVEFSCPKLKFD